MSVKCTVNSQLTEHRDWNHKVCYQVLVSVEINVLKTTSLSVLMVIGVLEMKY